MKSIIYPFGWLLAGVLLYSCSNFFDAEIELPTPDHDPLLVVNSYLLNTEDSILGARITRTYGLFEEQLLEEEIDDATVKLYKNGVLYQELNHTESFYTQNYTKGINTPVGEPGDELELEVSHPIYGTTRATQVFPEPVPLTDTDVRILSNTEFDGATAELRFTFTDPAGEENYYEILAVQECIYEYVDPYAGVTYRDTFQNTVFFDAEFDNDPNTYQGIAYESMLISDRNFDGQTITFRPNFYLCYSEAPLEEEALSFRIYWRTVTKDYFSYLTSVYQSQNASGNPFSEPVSVYTNMENGVGAFCVASELEYTIGE